ncbi:MAG TPA: hypothetical protein VHL80_09360, partial [Polyangia bacterium]|nr:hypothetical protein [Polyangia bacterium]
MRARSPFPAGAGPLLGAAAGAVVGVVDGARAALVFGVDARSIVAVVALAVAVDALAGWALGAVVELVGRAARWGRRARAPLGARAFAFLVAGTLALTATICTVEATLSRHNRYLAAGLAALAAVASAVPGALLAPALARLVSRRGADGEARPPGPALLLVAPPVAALLGGAIFASLWQAPLPAPGAALARFVLRVSAPALVLPWALVRAA